jgi:hypothetical protein
MTNGEGQSMRRRDFISRLGRVAGVTIALPGIGVVTFEGVRRALEGKAPLPSSMAPGSDTVPALAAAAEPAPDQLSALRGWFSPNQDVRAFLGPLKEGASLWRWRIAEVHDVRCGALPIVLQSPSGETFQVDVLRREAGLIAVDGVASTAHLSLYVVNGGNGRRRTNEEQGLGAIALALSLAAREKQVSQLPRLLTLRERSRHFPDGPYGVLEG